MFVESSLEFPTNKLLLTLPSSEHFLMKFFLFPSLLFSFTFGLPKIYINALSKYMPPKELAIASERIEIKVRDLLQDQHEGSRRLQGIQDEATMKLFYPALCSKRRELERILSTHCGVNSTECHRLCGLIVDAVQVQFIKNGSITESDVTIQRYILEHILNLRTLKGYWNTLKTHLEYRLAYIKLWNSLDPKGTYSAVIQLLDCIQVKVYKWMIQKRIQRIFTYILDINQTVSGKLDAALWYSEMTGGSLPPQINHTHELSNYLDKSVYLPLYALERGGKEGLYEKAKYQRIAIILGFLNQRLLDLRSRMSKQVYYEIDWHISLLYKVLENSKQ